MTGQTIAHYTLTEKIGAGGMGEVYRASDSKLNRDVAIKLIPPEFSRDPERMARFEREAQVLASLTHGSIAAVYGIEESDTGQRALVMELVDGEDLSIRLKRGPMPLDEALRTAVHIAGALEAAHDRGVIHRDLKPANIKLLPSGGVKLLDFGLAKALDDSAPSHLTSDEAATLSIAATRAGLVLGTAGYMSPEQATGTPADKRSDIWSFGVVLFEMLIGQRLFEGQTTSHVLADVIRAEIDFDRLPASTPPDLRTLIERALERDPRRRLRDIHDARLILERLVERKSGTHSALRSGAMPMAEPVAASKRDVVKWALGGAAVVALVVAAMGWMRPASGPSTQLRLAVRVADVPMFDASPGPAFDISPDGTQLALILGPGAGQDARKLVVRRLNELDSTTVVDPGPSSSAQQQPYGPFFSPDGQWIGYALPGEIKKVPAAGGTPMTIATVDRSRGAWWGEDGTIVLAPSPGSGLARVSASGGALQPVTTLDEAAGETSHRWPQILPGGKAVLFTAVSTPNVADAALEVVRLDSGERKVIQRGAFYGRYVASGHLVYAQDNALFVAPFDLNRLEVTGPAAPAVQNILTNTQGAASFAFASDGLLVYRQRVIEVQTHGIAWVDRAGRSSTLLAEHGTYANPRLSPDGKQLSLTVLRNRNWDIWVHDLERGIATRLTFDDAAETEQVWSPDGRELVYTAAEAGGEVLYRKRADGSGAPVRILSSKTGLWVQDWSPDGRLLALTGADNANDIGIVDLTAETPEVQWILNSRFSEMDPAISHDGRWMAYASNESGLTEVYVRQFPTGTGRWQVSHGGGGYPKWSRNGREIVYRTADGLAAASIDTSGSALRTGTPERLFTGSFVGGVAGMSVGTFVFPDYEPTADGSRFIMFPKPADNQAASIGMLTIVSDWFADLRRITGQR